MAVTYEWDIETVDKETDDIIDHLHMARLVDLPALDHTATTYQRLVLVRDVGNSVEGLTDRSWAYVENGMLPASFENGVQVPKRFHREITTMALRFGTNEYRP